MMKLETAQPSDWNLNIPDSFNYNLFRPQIILPVQYFGRARGLSQAQGEMRLMLAVLQDAINCFLSDSRASPRLFEEAREWLTVPNPGAPFSYDNICLALGIEPQPLRERLESLRRLRDRTGANWKIRRKSARHSGTAAAHGTGARLTERFSLKGGPAAQHNKARPRQVSAE